MASPVTLSMGHKLDLSFLILDQNGNPMLTQPAPDAAPVWSDTTPATETLAAAASGLTAVATPVAPGTDTINLSLVIGGKALTASLPVEVDAAPQVATSVVIVPAVE